jgi:hypothetical protein
MNTRIAVLVLTLVLALALGLMFRSLFPMREPSIPRIHTVYDTVRVIDTAWVTRLRRDTITVNVVERVTVTVPETVYVRPSLRGMTAVAVGARVGDSTVVGGFDFRPVGDSGYERRGWQAQYYTLGPLRSLIVDSGAPRIMFYDPPGKPCGSWCKLGHYLLGGSIGAGAAAIACTVTH